MIPGPAAGSSSAAGLGDARSPIGAVAGLPLPGGPLIWSMVVAVTGIAAAASVVIGVPWLVPAVIGAAAGSAVIVRYPFAGVLLYVAIFPIVSELSGVLYWVFHRLLLPGTLLVVLARRATMHRRPPFGILLGDWLMLAFVQVGLLNIFALERGSIDALTRFFDRAIIPLTAYWIIRLDPPRSPEIRRLSMCAIAMIAVQVVAGAAAWVVPGVLPAPWTKFAGARTVGTLGTVGAYSIVLGVCLALATDRVARLAGWARLVSAATTVAGGVFVILTFSRGSWLAMVPLLTSIVAIHRRAAAAVLIPFLLAGALLGSTVFADATTYATDRINSEETAESRVVVYAAAIRMIGERPVLGWGYDRFNDYVDRFRERFGDIPVNAEITSHNAYLTIGAELGAIAMLLYLGSIAYWLLKTLRTGRRIPNVAPVPRQLVILLWGAVGFSFVVGNFIDTIRYNELSTVFVWLALGLIATAVTTANNRTPGPRQRHDQRAE